METQLDQRRRLRAAETPAAPARSGDIAWLVFVAVCLARMPIGP